MKIAAFIPARLASTRFPNKPLEKICGKTMIEHVFQRAHACELLDEVYIATCDEEICAAAKNFGAQAIMTRDDHTRCTDRVAEAYENIKCDADIVVIIQGDEPLIRPDMIEASLQPLLEKDGKQIFCTNIACPIKEESEFIDPNEVKVVFSPSCDAVYFSREPIPSLKKGTHKNWWKQVCIMPFWAENLKKFNSMDETPLEIAESVDMLRVLENGYKLKMVKMDVEVYSVDTPQDLQKAESVMKSDLFFNTYKND